MPLRAGSGFWRGIQIRADSFSGERPVCVRGCASRLHRHGCYHRYAQPTGGERFAVQRYWCPECELTLSVLAADRLPYRPLEGPRLAAFFDAQAGIRSGPDPPPGPLEAGGLRRAWTRFQTRVSTLQEAFGLLVPRFWGSWLKAATFRFWETTVACGCRLNRLAYWRGGRAGSGSGPATPHKGWFSQPPIAVQSGAHEHKFIPIGS